MYVQWKGEKNIVNRILFVWPWNCAMEETLGNLYSCWKASAALDHTSAGDISRKALNTSPSINSLNPLSVLESDNKQKDNDSKNPGCPSALYFQILASLAPADEIFIAVVRFLISSRLCCLEASTVVPCSGFHGCLS